ncbi:MAG: putative peptidoglycan glycosyltransferase FtsW [Oscillospiraceae bacterium]
MTNQRTAGGSGRGPSGKPIERASRTGTTRGLTKIPAAVKSVPEDEQYTVGKVKRRLKYRIFNLGVGLDLPLLTIVLVLMAVGLVMLFSASYANAYYHYGDSYTFIQKQAGFAVVGVIAMLLISVIDYHQFHKMAPWIYAGSVVLLVLVLVLKGTDMAPVKGGANRWINIAGVEFQPSELAKFALVIMLAHIISKAGDQIKTFKGGVVPCLLCAGIIAGLVVAEKHISATIIILIISCIVMFVGGIRPRWFAALAGLGGVALTYLVFFTDKFAYALERLQGWIDPFNADAYQTIQSLYAIGSGQLLGVGLGQSRQKYLYLPEPQNDFIFAIVCEELGFVGALIIILLFVALIWRGVVISINAKDKFGMLIGLGMTFTVGVQAVLNICVVTNAIPNTGISLPFFSYGGTALLILLGEMGVLLSVSRGSYMEKT